MTLLMNMEILGPSGRETFPSVFITYPPQTTPPCNIPGLFQSSVFYNLYKQSCALVLLLTEGGRGPTGVSNNTQFSYAT